MTKPKQKSLEAISDMSMDEALARFIQTDPKEMAGAFQRVRQWQAEVGKRVDETREEIRRGIRPPGRKLRL